MVITDNTIAFIYLFNLKTLSRTMARFLTVDLLYETRAKIVEGYTFAKSTDISPCIPWSLCILHRVISPITSVPGSNSSLLDPSVMLPACIRLNIIVILWFEKQFFLIHFMSKLQTTSSCCWWYLHPVSRSASKWPHAKF